jgi:hypothetical protein
MTQSLKLILTVTWYTSWFPVLTRPQEELNSTLAMIQRKYAKEPKNNGRGKDLATLEN